MNRNPPREIGTTRISLASTLLLLMVKFSPLAAQAILQVPSAPTCAGCRIELERTAILGDEDGLGAFASRPYGIVRDSRGRYYAATPESRNETPFVFDSRGRFLQRLGRAGSGPNEFRIVGAIAVANDTVRVFDQELGRQTVLTPEYEVARTASSPLGVISAVSLGGGSVVVNAKVRDRKRIGLPLHMFDGRGNYVRSFGAERAIVDPRNVSTNVRWLSAGKGGSLWTAPFTHRYMIEQWDSSGTLLRRLERMADWFKPFARLANVTPKQAPSPRVLGLWEDEAGLIWTILHIADRQWATGLGNGAPAEGGQTLYAWEDRQKVFDTIIEVIDPSSGTIVARERYPGTVDFVVAPQMVGAVRERESGALFVEIWEVHLVYP